MAIPAFRVAIPARYASTRLPGKPLKVIAGRTMLEHVFRCAQASGATDIVIATEDERVRSAADQFGAKTCLTSSDHLTGTDRLAEVAELCGWHDDDIIVNLQGDEPLMPPALLDQVAAGLEDNPQAGIATLSTPIIAAKDIFDPHIVKVVTDAEGFALYFSRAPIPYHRSQFASGQPEALPTGTEYLRHIGLYAYRAGILRRYPTLTPAMAEQAEALEQLRALWHGIKIHVQPAAEPVPLGIDTEEDLMRVATLL